MSASAGQPQTTEVLSWVMQYLTRSGEAEGQLHQELAELLAEKFPAISAAYSASEAVPLIGPSSVLTVLQKFAAAELGQEALPSTVMADCSLDAAEAPTFSWKLLEKLISTGARSGGEHSELFLVSLELRTRAALLHAELEQAEYARAVEVAFAGQTEAGGAASSRERGAAAAFARRREELLSLRRPQQDDAALAAFIAAHPAAAALARLKEYLARLPIATYVTPLHHVLAKQASGELVFDPLPAPGAPQTVAEPSPQRPEPAVATPARADRPAASGAAEAEADAETEATESDDGGGAPATQAPMAPSPEAVPQTSARVGQAITFRALKTLAGAEFEQIYRQTHPALQEPTNTAPQQPAAAQSASAAGPARQQAEQQPSRRTEPATGSSRAASSSAASARSKPARAAGPAVAGSRSAVQPAWSDDEETQAPSSDPFDYIGSSGSEPQATSRAASKTTQQKMAASKRKTPPSSSRGAGGAPGRAQPQRGRAKRGRWTEQESQLLIDGVGVHGEGSWAAIHKGFQFNGRSQIDLKDRWRTMKKGGKV